MFSLNEISFEEIFPIWNEKLWPGRISKIKPIVNMKYLGGYDSNITKLYHPKFFGLFHNKKIIGCNSGHGTNNGYRSRGLRIEPKYRNRGLSKLLFMEIEKQATKEKY